MKDDLKILLEKNLALTEDIHRLAKKTNKYILMTQIVGVIKILLILVPIVFSIIYLPPLLKDLMNDYQDLMPVNLNVPNNTKNLP